MSIAAPDTTAVDIDDELEAWLQQTLPVKNGNVNQATFRATVFDEVERNGFVANLTLTRASSVVAGRPISDDTRDETMEQTRKREVREFVNGFLKKDISERKQQFKELRARCKNYPHLVARLNELKPLLKTKTERRLSKLKEKPKLLGELMLRLFCMPRNRRAVIQHQVLFSQKSEQDAWLKARNKLRSKCNAIAKTSKPFLDDFDCWKYKQRHVVRRMCQQGMAIFFLLLVGFGIFQSKKEVEPNAKKELRTERVSEVTHNEPKTFADTIVEEPWKEVLEKNPDSFRVQLRSQCDSLGDDEFVRCLVGFSDRCEERLPAILKHRPSIRVQYIEICRVVEQACKRKPANKQSARYKAVLESLLSIGKELKQQYEKGGQR